MTEDGVADADNIHLSIEMAENARDRSKQSDTL